MKQETNQLVQAAGAAAAAGRWQDAERLWQQVCSLDPDNVQARYSLGVHAFQRGDLAAAEHHLKAAHQRAPNDAFIPATLARIYRDSDQPEAEWDAIIAALAIDPYHLPGLLAKAEHVETRHGARMAASAYRDVMKVAPDEPQWPPVLAKRLAHARDAVARDTDGLMDFLHGKVAAARSGVAPAMHGRWDEAVSILAGKTRPYHSECNRLQVPRLPAITFYDDALFPWMRELESRTEAVKAELRSMLAARDEEFVPYIQYSLGDPVNQWDKLNHSRNWKGFHLYSHGDAIQKHLAQCPRTAEALALAETAAIPGLCPNAMFSALAPHTHIPPHSGETNARLVVHLPLMVPEGCSFRVGYDTRQWREGKCWVFDDSIEHEARNDSDQLRVILMFDVWNPLLSLEERDMIVALENAMREWRAANDPV